MNKLEEYLDRMSKEAGYDYLVQNTEINDEGVALTTGLIGSDGCYLVFNDEDFDKARQLPTAKQHNVFGEEILRMQARLRHFPWLERTDYPIYVVTKDTARNYLIGRHSTNTLFSSMIQKHGFKPRINGSPVFFHRAMRNIERDNYGNKMDLSLVHKFCSYLNEYSNFPRIENIEDFTDEFIKRLRGLPEEDFIRKLLQDNLETQVLEAIIPKTKVSDERNGGFVEGIFKGYEIGVDSPLTPEHILYVSEPFKTTPSKRTFEEVLLKFRDENWGKAPLINL